MHALTSYYRIAYLFAMKICKQCGVKKPLSDFYRKRVGTWNGYWSICKECAKEKQSHYCATKAYRSRHREYAKKHREKNPDAYKAIKKRYRTQHHTSLLERNKTRYRIQKAARRTIADAVKSGKIIMPTHCEQCGQRANLHAHHADYSQPFTVEWLCPSCHGKRHRLKTPLPSENDGHPDMSTALPTRTRAW